MTMCLVPAQAWRCPCVFLMLSSILERRRREGRSQVITRPLLAILKTLSTPSPLPWPEPPTATLPGKLLVQTSSRGRWGQLRESRWTVVLRLSRRPGHSSTTQGMPLPPWPWALSLPPSLGGTPFLQAAG